MHPRSNNPLKTRSELPVLIDKVSTRQRFALLLAFTLLLMISAVWARQAAMVKGEVYGDAKFRCPSNAVDCDPEACPVMTTSFSIQHISIAHVRALAKAALEIQDSSALAGIPGNSQFAEIRANISTTRNGDRSFALMTHRVPLICEAADDTCDPIVLVDFDLSGPRTYDIAVEMKNNEFLQKVCRKIDSNDYGVMWFVDYMLFRQAFTRYEITTKYVCLGITIIVCLLYLLMLRLVPRTRRSLEQNTIAVMLIALAVFNDPLITMAQDATGLGAAVLFIYQNTATSFFFALLAFYWVCALSMVRQTHNVDFQESFGEEGEGGAQNATLVTNTLHTFWKEAVLACIVFLTSFLIEWYRNMDQFVVDPNRNRYTASTHSEWLQFVFVTMGILLLLYIWVMLEWCLSRRRQPITSRLGFLLLCNTIALIFLILSGVMGSTQPLPEAKDEFVTLLLTCNFYTWLVAFAYAPSLPEVELNTSFNANHNHNGSIAQRQHQLHSSVPGGAHLKTLELWGTGGDDAGSIGSLSSAMSAASDENTTVATSAAATTMASVRVPFDGERGHRPKSAVVLAV